MIALNIFFLSLLLISVKHKCPDMIMSHFQKKAMWTSIFLHVLTLIYNCLLVREWLEKNSWEKCNYKPFVKLKLVFCVRTWYFMISHINDISSISNEKTPLQYVSTMGYNSLELNPWLLYLCFELFSWCPDMILCHGRTFHKIRLEGAK